VKLTVDRICYEIPVDSEIIAASPTPTEAKARRMNARERFNFIIGMPKRSMRILKKNARKSRIKVERRTDG
jgi:hypothetical protein